MEIINERKGPYNFGEELRPLFEAMQAGKKIKSVTCMMGITNKDDTSKDFKLEDFIARIYWVANGYSVKDGDLDYVETNADAVGRINFYMCWVRSFELY